MNKNVCSMLLSYFQYQRDLGVENIVFGQGSNIRTILTGKAAHPVAPPRAKTPSPAAAGERATRPNAPVTPPAPAKPQALSGLAKLSQIRTVDTLVIGKPSSVARTSSATPSQVPVKKSSAAKANTPKREKMAALYRETQGCDKCALSNNRRKVVFGTGSADGRLFIIGDAPSILDENAGLPFCGDTGELLDKILTKMGLDKGIDTFISYLQKCRGSAEFHPDHAAVCKRTLDRQIEIVAPKCIIIFGQAAANIILDNEIDIEFLRGMDHVYKNIPTVVTYDLPLMSREPQRRYGAWNDMTRVMDILK